MGGVPKGSQLRKTKKAANHRRGENPLKKDIRNFSQMGRSFDLTMVLGPFNFSRRAASYPNNPFSVFVFSLSKTSSAVNWWKFPSSSCSKRLASSFDTTDPFDKRRVILCSSWERAVNSMIDALFRRTASWMRIGYWTKIFEKCQTWIKYHHLANNLSFVNIISRNYRAFSHAK